MAVSKSNGVPASRRRRRAPVVGDAAAGEGPVSAPVSPAASVDAPWVARLDELAVALGDLHDRGTIIDRVVREALSLLPAENVVVRADVSKADDAAVADGAGTPDRAVIPLDAGGKRFGALELQVKAGRRLDAAERTFLVALGRQSAMALDRASVADTQREALQKLEAARAADRDAIAAAFEHVVVAVRALARLARSTALPTAASVAEAERLANARLDELRGAVSVAFEPGGRAAARSPSE
jgi:hypothetical protein